MAKAIDYLHDESFDLIIENGDFKKGDATLQHQKMLLLSQKGNYKQFPTVGVGIRDFINEDTTADELQKAIQQEFETDGMTIETLVLKSFKDIEIIASYGS